jgi:coenzyme F420-reducing hydrogenase gamma subunit
LRKKKLAIGFFSLSCCEGCELAVLDLEEKLLQAFKQVEIVESRLLMERIKPAAARLDIAFVEGSVVSKQDLDKLHYIREKTDFLVAFGACAAIAGIPGIRNALPASLQEKVKRQAIKPLKEKVYSLSAFVQVDHLLQGCSINELEFLDFLNKYLHGVKPRLEEVPVCFECKLRENDCLLLKGIACLGPASYAGCDALCPSQNAQCIGCRGFTKDANFKALDGLFKGIGLSKKERYNLFTYFNPLPEQVKHLEVKANA